LPGQRDLGQWRIQFRVETAVIIEETTREVPKNTICVLGMHRSGTSCLTGSLEQAGVELGDRHTWNPFNQKGNRESQEIVDLHDEILRANGGSWDRPPEAVQWTVEHYDRARQLLRRYSHFEVYGFKDPRTLLVLDGWRDIGLPMQHIGIFRHPNVVAASLHRRDNKSRRECLHIWYEYNMRLLRQYDRSPFPILCFDEPDEVFFVKLKQVILGLGLHPVEGEDMFYDKQLKNFTENRGPWLPWKVRRLYRRLRAVSI